jgi:predicted alpha/beta hydrolase family esterase
MDTAKAANEISIVIVPPWENAGEDHWMTLWQGRDPRLQRVEQKDWNDPSLAEWSNTLVDFVNEQDRPVILVAHSLGAATVVHSAKRIASKVVAAMLVAPPDVEQPSTPVEIKEFAPLPLERLPFPSVLIASEDDVYCSLERSKLFAESWGSDFVNIGEAGHINPKAGFGEWEQGERLLGELIDRVLRGERAIA